MAAQPPRDIPDEKKPLLRSRGFWLTVIGAVLAVALSAAVGAIIAINVDRTNKKKAEYAKSPEAEYGRLAKLTTGISLARFQELLEDEAYVQRSAPGGYKRYIFGRPYVYVLAVTDKDQTVVSFSVMVRQSGFHPAFDDIVLGQTTLASAWDTPEALGGLCGHDVAYFERTAISNADPVVRSLGINHRGYSEEKDFELLCGATEHELLRCEGYLGGEDDLSPEAVDCFLNTEEGKLLRQGLRPNIYAEGAPFQELPLEFLTPSDPEIMAAEG